MRKRDADSRRSPCPALAFSYLLAVVLVASWMRLARELLLASTVLRRPSAVSFIL